MDAMNDIKKLLGSERMLIGAEETLKALRSSTLEKVYLSTNPKESLKEDIVRYAGMAGVEVISLSVPNDELGTLCKKPFPISVIGLKKE